MINQQTRIVCVYDMQSILMIHNRLCFFQVGYDPHAQMRAPLGPGLGIPGGKP